MKLLNKFCKRKKTFTHVRIFLLLKVLYDKQRQNQISINYAAKIKKNNTNIQMTINHAINKIFRYAG